jgi:hypothetical protein
MGQSPKEVQSTEYIVQSKRQKKATSNELKKKAVNDRYRIQADRASPVPTQS